MATYNTPFYLTQDTARTNTSRLAAPNVASGDVEFAVIKYIIGAGHASGQTIALCALPAGCIPLPQLSSVTANNDPTSGSTFTLKVGTASIPGGWADDISLANGGQVACTSGVFPAWMEPTPLPVDAGSGNAVIICTISGANAALDVGDILYFTLAYKRSKG